MLSAWFLTLLCASLASGETQCTGTEYKEHLASGANDVVAVQQADGSLASTAFDVRIGKLTNLESIFKSREGRPVELVVNDAVVPVSMVVSGSGAACFVNSGTPAPSPQELAQMGLKLGPNSGLYRVPALSVSVEFTIFVLAQTDRLVVTDVDGTVTKSNTKGVLGAAVGLDEDQVGVVELFQKVAVNGYKLVYLTARPMGVEKETKKYLFTDLQNVGSGGFSLPLGPVFFSLGPLDEAANVQKTKTLISLLSLFDAKADVVRAAYGNAQTDVQGYTDAGIPAERVFLVNEAGVLHNVVDNKDTSYTEQAANVDQLFPRINN